MKKIAVFFKLPGAMDAPISMTDYWIAYSQLSEEVKARGGQFYITRGQDTYLGKGSFSKSWIIEGDHLTETGLITVDVVYNKGQFKNDGGVIVFNCDEIRKQCDDKWLMYQRLKDLCPSTFCVENKSQLQEVLPKISTSKAVFKPRVGGGGEGVQIEEKAYFMQDTIILTFPALVSEFLDTSVGISGIVEGTHDFRIAIFDGEILYSYVRTPPKGKWLANVDKGGTWTVLDLKKLPQDALDIVASIDKDFEKYGHRFYSVDFGYTAEGPKIIEMNSMLGLFRNDEHPVFKTVKEKLAEVFMDL